VKRTLAGDAFEVIVPGPVEETRGVDRGRVVVHDEARLTRVVDRVADQSAGAVHARVRQRLQLVTVC